MPQYDPETLIVHRNALDEAWALLPDDRKSESQRADMAQRIEGGARRPRPRQTSGPIEFTMRPLPRCSGSRLRELGRALDAALHKMRPHPANASSIQPVAIRTSRLV